MIARIVCMQILNRPLAGLVLLGALAGAACDPGDIIDIIDGTGGSTVPPSGGTGGSGTGGSGTGGGSTGGGDGTPTNPCAAVLCITGTHCEEQLVQCIKAPCPTQAVCVKDPQDAHCGGITGRPCPGSGTCVDDPADSCDPKAGGADCGGICQCARKADCPEGSKFDSSPNVCSCISSTPPSQCGPVCTIFCEYGNVLDANGCATCSCNPPPPQACGPVCAIYCEHGNVLDDSGCPTCACNPPPTVQDCPVEKCPTPAPKSVNYQCRDGRTTAGPACQLTAAGKCDWTIVTCPN